MVERIGVLAVQGDFEKHVEALVRAGVDLDRIVEVRTPEELGQADRLILPGGESTTVGLLLQRFGLGLAIQERAAQGMPIWGTCMGMILMATEIVDRPEQYRLRLLDITVERNAFGAQVHSFEAALKVEGLSAELTAVFIRAPAVVRMGAHVVPLAEFEGRVVAVRESRRLGTSFHPELTEDVQLHQLFLNL